MSQIIDQAVRPRLNDDASCSMLGDEVVIQDGVYRAVLRTRGASVADVGRLKQGLPGDQLIDEFAAWLNAGEVEAREAIKQLFDTGLLIDPNAEQLDVVPGAYVACRLLDYFRRSFPRAVQQSPLLQALSNDSNPGLAMGFLLETYFVVRAASWSAKPVFLHNMTRTQRLALEDFDASESGHGELLLTGFAEAGWDPDQLRSSPEAVETMAYSHAYGSFAVRGVPQFAAALVLPEVPASGARVGKGAVDVLDLLGERHDVPDAVLHPFRLHDDDDVEGDHAGMPALLLSEEAHLTPRDMQQLFTILRQMIDLYRSLLDGIYRRYQHWDPRNDGLVMPKHAFRFTQSEVI